MKAGFLPVVATCMSWTLAFGCASLGAQQPDAPAGISPTSNDPALTIRNQKALESFEPAANEEYTLGPGDEISLDFPGRPELASKSTVGPDGRITLPLVGPIHVAELSRTDSGKAIADALSKYYTDLSVTVKIDKYSSNRVRVLGYVQHPGEILFEETPTLLDAIGRAGLISPTVSKDGVATNVGTGIPEMCTIFRGNDTAVQVQLRTLLMSGNSLADMRLRRNDIVYVPQPKELFVSVLGAVTKPGNVPLTPESTLSSILAMAGGLTDGAGSSPNIRIIQPSTGKDFKVSYKKLMTLAGQQEFTIHSGDVIIIPKSGFENFTYVLQKISPIATIVSLAALVGAG